MLATAHPAWRSTRSLRSLQIANGALRGSPAERAWAPQPTPRWGVSASVRGARNLDRFRALAVSKIGGSTKTKLIRWRGPCRTLERVEVASRPFVAGAFRLELDVHTGTQILAGAGRRKTVYRQGENRHLLSRLRGAKFSAARSQAHRRLALN